MGNEGSIEPIPYDVEVAWHKPEASKGEAPSPREAHIAVFIGRKLYIFGGGSSGTQHSDLFSFDVDDKSWTEHQVAEGQIAPPKSTGACAAAVGNSIYVFGGLNMEQEWSEDLYVFNTDTNEWKKPEVSGKGPSKRDKHCCCSVGSKIFFFGGFGPQEPAEDEEDEIVEEGEGGEAGEAGPCATFGWFNDLYVLDTVAMSWQQPVVRGRPPSARAAAALTEANNKLYLFGGRDSNQRQNDLHVLDLETMTWSMPKITGSRPIARSFHTFTAISKQHAVVLGGLSSTNILLNDVHVYDFETSAWVQPKVSEAGQPTPRRFHSATLVDQSLYVFGGADEFDAATNESSKFSNELFVLPLGPILTFGPVKLPESALGGTTITSSGLTSSGGLINLGETFQLSGEAASVGTFSFGGDKGVKRKREDEKEKEKEDDEEKEKEK